MKELLLTLVQAIVERPEEVEIIEKVDEEGRIDLVIVCNPEDRGLVVGKQGKNINAIRTIVKIKAVKEKKFVTIRLDE